MIHYKKLKQQKIVNLFSEDAVKTLNGGRNLIFQFYLPYDFSTFSKNTEIKIDNVSYYNSQVGDTDSIFLFRCEEVVSYDIYDTTTYQAPIVYHTQPLSSKIQNAIPYKVNMPLNKLTFIVSDIVTGGKDYGVNANDKFIITLCVTDYDIEQVEPSSMPIIEKYSHIPQMKIIY